MPRSLLPLVLYYVGYYGTYGVLLPIFSPFLRSRGLDAREIGLLASLAPAFTATTPFVFGYLADRFQRRAALLALATFLSASGLAFLVGVSGPLALLLAMTVYALFRAPLIPLIDTLTLLETKRLGLSYARTRLFGSLAFVVGAALIGLWADHDRDVAEGPGMWLSVGLFYLAFLSALFVPRALGGGQARPRVQEALALLRDRRILVLVFASALHWTTLAPYHLFFSVYVEDLGLSPFVAGGGMALGALCETAMMWWFPRHTSGRYSQALVLAFLVTGGRWVLTAYSTDPTLLLLVQGLHAFSFGLFYPAALAALGELVPDHLRATGQGLFISVLGAASFGGDLSSGFIYDRFGGRGLYLCAAALSVLSALFLRSRAPSGPAELTTARSSSHGARSRSM